MVAILQINISGKDPQVPRKVLIHILIYVSLYITSPRNVILFLTVGVMTASSRGNVEPLGTEMLNGIQTCSPTTSMAKSEYDCRTIFSKSQIIPAPT